MGYYSELVPTGAEAKAARFSEQLRSGPRTQRMCFHKQDWHVQTIPLGDCTKLVSKYHYARGGSNTATFRHGLFDAAGVLCGCAWWIPPTKSAAIANWDGDWKKVLALSRLVIVPGVPTNGASFLIGRSVRLIRQSKKYECLLTYADDWRGHEGTIYKATNWEYLGKTKPERTYTKDGRMLARKAGPKTRTHAEMLGLGAKLEGSFAKHRFRLIL